ncbi:hypothetical protein [Propionimicrobium sp. PCR01-08-3]|uniref:hypothetical protein n=1 Tax=Propionimicrobium sp. PCR01-08-3 TaxID=3052086 RepID=UPI00255C311E|nr:hypothetical protein [Propionimicrobium sp. PCR01-08-3]WIY83512.1 hypothetical protein QQ658_03920 [Propionimicrobium sp. PCR01-08-3]
MPSDDAASTAMARLAALDREGREGVLRAVNAGKEVENPALAALAVDYAILQQRVSGPRMLRQRWYWLGAVAGVVLVYVGFGWLWAIVALAVFLVAPYVASGRVRSARLSEEKNRALLQSQGE